MKKAAAVICCVLSAGLLAGCSVEDVLLSTNSNYQHYKALKEENADHIDADGLYQDPEIEEAEADDGTVRVTFATDTLVKINYFTDEARTEAVDETNCRLHPGDSLYTKRDVSGDAEEKNYEFKGFRLAGFDGENRDFNLAQIEGDTITLPEDLTYTEISVIPWGEFKKDPYTLRQPEHGGTITYTLNGSEIEFGAGVTSVTIDYEQGDELTAKIDTQTVIAPFQLNSALATDLECSFDNDNKLSFRAKDDKNGEWVSLEQVIVVSEEKMPTLTVIADKSCGDKAKFQVIGSSSGGDFKADDLPMKETSATDAVGGTKLFDGKFNPAAELSIKLSDWSREENEGIRLRVTYKSGDTESVKTYYIAESAGSQVLETKPEKSDKYYDEIKVEIDKVNGAFFSAEDYPYENAHLTFSFDEPEQGGPLEEGAFVGNDRKIKMTVTAEKSYQLLEKAAFGRYKLKDNWYEATCSFKDLRETFDDMKDKTKIEKKEE